MGTVDGRKYKKKLSWDLVTTSMLSIAGVGDAMYTTDMWLTNNDRMTVPMGYGSDPPPEDE